MISASMVAPGAPSAAPIVNVAPAESVQLNEPNVKLKLRDSEF
jgi:hypothetical protein